MARLDNIYFLLKNAEVFIKRVPIKPGLPDTADWKARRTELTRAFKKAYKALKSLEEIDAEALTFPCRKIPVKQALALPLRPCGKPLIRQVREELRPLRPRG